MTPRERVVEAAVGCLGVQDPDRFWREVCPAFIGHPHEVSWCGGFALWCLREAGLCDWNWIPGKGFLFRLGVAKDPSPGDIVYLADLSHHAVVEEVLGDMVVTIDGNTMPYPVEGVTRKHRHRSAITAVYSIEPLVEPPTEPEAEAA